MTTAQHLDLIDRLRAQCFSAGPVRLGRHSGGPGYHLVALGETRDFWDDDGTGHIEAAEEIEAAYEALARVLSCRWGEPQVFTLDSPAIHGPDRTRIPQPWEELSGGAREVSLWRAEDRWLVICVAGRGETDPYVLMAGITVIDPP
ncbi:hypothetical protein ACIRP0_21285 [Streptomyces sp. NPDC101733]|uniref:hypothetical protein n=1 Tax=unclassified Streptomyces TaxID=2593676 RepID=UPI0038247164